MIRLRLHTVVMAILFLGLSSAGIADDKSDIQIVFDKLARAFLSGNADAIGALTTPDFTYKHANGMTEKGAAMVAQLKKEFTAGMRVTKWDSRILNLKVTGNSASAKNSTESTMSMKEPDGKAHLYGSKSLSNDTLVKGRDGWKFKNVVVLKDQMTRDGKPFDPSAMMNPPKPKKK